MISLHTLKLALNKSMRASDDEQGSNKLRPKLYLTKFHENISKKLFCTFHNHVNIERMEMSVNLESQTYWNFKLAGLD